MSHAAFLAAILAAPGDPTPKRVYADWLEEEGRDNDAYALRWMAAHKKHPRKYANGEWNWRFVGTVQAGKQPWNLTESIFRTWEFLLRDRRESFADCVHGLGFVLRILRDELAL